MLFTFGFLQDTNSEIALLFYNNLQSLKFVLELFKSFDPPINNNNNIHVASIEYHISLVKVELNVFFPVSRLIYHIKRVRSLSDVKYFLYISVGVHICIYLSYRA